MASPCLPRARGKSRRACPCAGYVLVVRRPARGRVDALEDVLLDVGRRRDERDLVGAPLQAVEIAVARRLDEAFDRAAVLREVGDDRRVRLVPSPRLVPVVLEVRRQLAGVRIDGNGGRRVEIVAGALVAEPRRRVARAPVGQVQRRIVRPGDPDGSPPFFQVSPVQVSLPFSPGAGTVYVFHAADRCWRQRP